MQVQAYPRYRYVISAVPFIDFPLWIELRHHAWITSATLLLLMLVITAERMAEIGWERKWAIPYCCVTVSPFAALVLLPNMNPWVVFGCVAALHIPVMAWPQTNQQSAPMQRAVASGVQEAVNTSFKSIGSYFMSIVPDAQRLAERWPFATVVVLVAALWMAFATLLAGVPSLVQTACGYALVVVWVAALKARLVRVGLWRRFWPMTLYILFVLLVCLFLMPAVFRTPALLPGLFVLLNLPLIILRDKPQGEATTGG